MGNDMKKYIVETVAMYRMCHVVEVEDDADIPLIIRNADDNWQEHLGELQFDKTEYTEEKIARFREKKYFWDGVAYIGEDGYIKYRYPDGSTRDAHSVKVK